LATGAADSQCALQDHRRRVAGGKAAGGELFGGAAYEPDDGDGEPGRWERAVKVAGVLASSDDLFEPGDAGEVSGGVSGMWALGESRAEQEGVSADELPADLEIPAQRSRGRGGVKAGGVHGGDGFGSRWR